MGNKVPTFTEEQLEDYQDCTFFARKEILRVYKRYKELDPSKIPKVMTGDEAHTITVSLEKVEKLAELRENPFRQRICKVFSHDGSGNMTFDDFLDMLSCLSEQSPRDVKLVYAFRMFDYDGDQFIGSEDLRQATVALTRSELPNDDVDIIVEKVLEEGDVDDDGKLSFVEFQSIISKAPDFLRQLCDFALKNKAYRVHGGVASGFTNVHIVYPLLKGATDLMTSYVKHFPYQNLEKRTWTLFMNKYKKSKKKNKEQR